MEQEPKRDLVWDAMYEFAMRTEERAMKAGLTVMAIRKRHLGSWSVVEGLWIGDNWSEVFEPVRRRRFFSKDWIEIQPVQTAASAIGYFLRHRPDLGSAGSTDS